MSLVGVVLLLAGWFGGRYLWATYHLRRAEQALAHYDFPEALEDIERYLRIYPSSAPTRLLAARTARRADLLDRAGEHLDACEKQGVTEETALERLLLRAQEGNLEDDRMLQNLIRQDHPDSVLIIEALARGYMKANRGGDPVFGAFGDLIKRAPDYPWAYYWRGRTYELVSRWADAVADHRRAVELAPHRREFRLRLAETLLRRGLAAEAQPHLEELLRTSPGDPTALVGLARCRRILLEPARAVELLDFVLAEHPDHAEAWMERGRACDDRNDHAEALRCFRRAADLDPNNYQMVFALFTALNEQGRRAEAQALEKRLDQLKRDELRRKEILAQLGKAPHNAALRYELGQIYLRFRAVPAAVQSFHEALRDDPEHRPSHRALADYYEKTGNAEAAAFHRQRGSPAP
jgi:tetratricopeptide (TPR) repeat protein